MVENYSLKIRGAQWWHTHDHHSPNLTKASLGTFFNAVLSEGAQIGEVWTMNPNYPRSIVLVTVFATREMIDNIESKTKFRFREPPKVSLN